MSAFWSREQLEAYAATLDYLAKAHEAGLTLGEAAELQRAESPCESVDHPPGLPWTCGCPQQGVLSELAVNTEPVTWGHEPYCGCLTCLRHRAALRLDLTRAQAAGRRRARNLIEQEQLRRSWARYQEERCTCDEAPGSHTGDCPLAETLTGTSEHAPEPAPVTVATIRAAILEPLGLPGDQLPAWGTPLEEGSCSSCLLPVATASGRCLYCQALHDMLVTKGSIGAELARRRETCRHGKHGSFIRDGRCCRCGTTEAAVIERRTVRHSGIVMLLAVTLLGVALVLYLAKAGVL